MFGDFSCIRQRVCGNTKLVQGQIWLRFLKSQECPKNIGICLEALISHSGILKNKKTKQIYWETKQIKIKRLICSPHFGPC